MDLTPYEPTTWVNNSEPDLDAANLNKVEQGIKDAIDGVNGILAALTNQLSTDPDKYAGIAVVNQLNTALNNLSNTVDTLNSNLTVQQLALTLLNATNQANYITVYNKIRFANLSFRPSINLSSGTTYTFATLSATHKPSYQCDVFSHNNLGHKYRITLETSGDLKLAVYDDIAIGELILGILPYAVS